MSMSINTSYNQYSNYYQNKLSLRNMNKDIMGETPDSVREENLQKQMQIEEMKGKEVNEQYKEEECQTCKNRKYQDGSDDSGVSFQTPTHIDSGSAAGAVRGHENEHVVREQAKAEREGRRVVSQTVQIHTSICPECGKVYVSGGTTRTTTASQIKARYDVGKNNENSTYQAQI